MLKSWDWHSMQGLCFTRHNSIDNCICTWPSRWLWTGVQWLCVCHVGVVQVVQMMNTDLLRQQQKWKDSLMEIRQIMTNLVQQVERMNASVGFWLHFVKLPPFVALMLLIQSQSYLDFGCSAYFFRFTVTYTVFLKVTITLNICRDWWIEISDLYYDFIKTWLFGKSFPLLMFSVSTGLILLTHGPMFLFCSTAGFVCKAY